MNDVNLANAGLDQEEDVSPPKKSGGLAKGIMIVTVVILVEVVLAVVVVTKFVLPNQGISIGAATPAEANEASGDVPEGAGVVFEVKDVIVNPAETQGTRYLSATIGLETYESELIEELETREALVRDTLINILSSKRLDELDGVVAKDSLRKEILEMLNPHLTHGQIAKVYFTNYVIQ